MKFDVIIGNPPYNNQLWTKFFRWAIRQGPHHCMFVTPDTWQQSTRLLKLFSKWQVQWWSVGNPWTDAGITTSVAITHISEGAVGGRVPARLSSRWQWKRSQHCIAICRSRLTRDDIVVVVGSKWEPRSGQWTWLTCTDEREAHSIRDHILQNAARLNASRHAGWLNQKLLLEILEIWDEV
jgi:hypothetical protein